MLNLKDIINKLNNVLNSPDNGVDFNTLEECRDALKDIAEDRNEIHRYEVVATGIVRDINYIKHDDKKIESIIKEYNNGELPLYHMDVYRLDGNTEGVDIEEYFTKGGVVVIEWAETIKNILPEERLDIKFKVLDENRRLLIFEPHGEKYEELCEAVL